MLLAVDGTVTEEMRDLAAELGVDIEPAGLIVKDHFHHDGLKGPSVVVAGSVIDAPAIIDKPIKVQIHASIQPFLLSKAL